MCIFSGASCATTSTLVLFALSRPRHGLKEDPCLVLYTLSGPVSFALYSCILELGGGVFDVSLRIRHITSYLHASREGGCQVLS